jgi:hypothetical protein
MDRRRKPGATKPQGIVEKFKESQFFLACIGDCQRSAKIDDFLFCLSAFLPSFGSIRYRLLGVVEVLQEKSAKRILESSLRSHPKIGFLLNLRDVEIHSDGFTVWPIYRLTDTQIGMPGPLELHFFPKHARNVKVFGFRFEEHQPYRDLIEFCHDALSEFEEIFRQNVPAAS